MTLKLADPRVREGILGDRVIDDGTDFVYVMRTDTAYICNHFAERLDLPSLRIGSLIEQYENFLAALASLLADSFETSYRTVAIDLLDGEAVDSRRRALILPGSIVVSLDPLAEQGAWPLAFSRCYALGGKHFLSMVARPGYAPIGEQVEAIAATGSDIPITVIEDDIFTGETISQTLRQYLGTSYRRVHSLVAGTRIGGEALEREHFKIEAATVYRLPDGASAIHKLDLGDPRDYLIGASGLVVRVPGDKLGRLPYLLPFVSPTARATLPPSSSERFSLKALSLGLEFYEGLEDIARRRVSLSDCDPYFTQAAGALLGVAATERVSDVINMVCDRFDELCTKFQA